MNQVQVSVTKNNRTKVIGTSINLEAGMASQNAEHKMDFFKKTGATTENNLVWTEVEAGTWEATAEFSTKVTYRLTAI